MTTENNRTAQFSAAVALIYGSIVGEIRRTSVEQALRVLLDADEVVFTCQRTVPSDLFDSYGGEDGQRHDGRGGSRVLSLDIVDRGYDKLRLIAVRHPDRAAFTDTDLAWLSLLQPHLQNAAMVRDLLAEGVIGSTASSQLARTMSEGLLVLSSECEIQWLNPSALKILAAQHGLSNINGRLRAARAFETARIELLVREAADGRPGVMLVGQTTMWLPYGLAFAPLAFDVAPPSGVTTQSRSVLVTIKDMRHHTDVIIVRLTEVFGFTKAEQRIAAMLLAGHSLGDAAGILGKSLATVRKQLRSMLTKTGAHSQAELLSMFLSVPSLI